MKRLTALVLLILPCATVSAEALDFTFDGSRPLSEWKIPLAEISPALPADWPVDGYLVLEWRTSSSQRFELRVYTSAGYSRLMMQPYCGVWVRSAIAVKTLSEPPGSGGDMAAVGNRSRPGYFLGLWGPFRPMKSVEALGFVMERAIGSPRLEIRSIRVSRDSPGDAVLDPGPYVDEFGQWTHGDWLGKVRSLDDLKKAWAAENLSAPADFGYCRYGGFLGTKSRSTGFFRLEKVDGNWWFVDPDGHLFLSVGSDVITPFMDTRTNGRSSLFAALPPAARERPMRGDDSGASFFTWNLMRRYGADRWMQMWVDDTLRRMESWGLNTVANWSASSLWDSQKKAYAIPLRRWETSVSYLGLPDVYSEEFTRNAEASAQAQCAARRNDPWLLGYFLANEPPFPQKEQQTAQLILDGPDTATQRELKKWLSSGDTPERRKEFIDGALDRYIQATSEAVKRHDPNHLNLGMRSGGRPTDAEIRAARAFDVYSVNIYNYEVSAERVRRISELTGKPVLIGEFHFGTPGRGLAASLVQVRDQAERGVAYRYYVEQAFAMPEMIGTHWFQWADQPCTGRFDGENYNIGLVDVTDRPYAELVDALKTTHKRLQALHSGNEKPFSRRAAPN
jgi:hypothetical protein